MERVRVVLRIRPNADGSDDEDIIDVRDSRKIIISKPGKKNTYLLSQQTRYYEYTFDHVFPPNSDQESVYNVSTCNFLRDAISNGINLTVFVYGATGTGKTYTIIGNERNPGIVIRGINETFDYLFKNQEFQENKHSRQNDSNNSQHDSEINSKYFVTASYMEIYNETIRDLLNPSSNFNNTQYSCEILEDQSSIQISNLTQLLIKDSKEGIQALNFGNKHRKIEQTAANNVSSRSHAIFQLSVFIEGKKSYINLNNHSHKFIRSSNYRNDYFPTEKLYKPSINGTTSSQIWCKISFIDLAGSERASATQNRGIRLTEGAHINRSLLALANCINSLASATPIMDSSSAPNQNANDIKYHVKYRDSKLTHLLKNSLEGEKCFVVMIANISPSSKAFEESQNTLKYANRAKNIKVKISNQILNENEEISCTCNCHLGMNGFNQTRNKQITRNDSYAQTVISGIVYKETEKSLDGCKLNYGMRLINDLYSNIYRIIDSIGEYSSSHSLIKKTDNFEVNDDQFFDEKENSSYQITEISTSVDKLNRTSFVSTQSNDEIVRENKLSDRNIIEDYKSIKELQYFIFNAMVDSLNKLNEIKLEYNEVLNNEALLLKKIQDLAEDFSIKRQKKYGEVITKDN